MGGFVADLQEAGVGILAGTDSPAMPGMVTGFSLHDELQLMASAGLTPLQALQTATVNPAQFLGRFDELGTIEPGKSCRHCRARCESPQRHPQRREVSCCDRAGVEAKFNPGDITLLLVKRAAVLGALQILSQ